MTSGADPVGGGLDWRDLKPGERVAHFDYGAGTVDSVSELHIWITWDDSGEQLHHRTTEFVPHLNRLPA